MTTSTAIAVAERLLDPASVTDAIPAADAASLSHGLAGTALLHARLSTVDAKFARAAIHHWGAAATILRTQPDTGGGLQGGRAGLAASFIIGIPYLPEPDQSQSHATRSAVWISALARDIAADYATCPPDGRPAWHHYDTITGLAGTGRILLAAHQNGYIETDDGLTAVLETLTAMLHPRHHPRPGWWTPARTHPPGVTVDASGAAATGLAHGVAGPLAFLAIAHRAGWRVEGQAEAVRHAAIWLLRWQATDGRWPPNVTGTELDTRSPAKTTGRADAWCYGTPGISKALHLAGLALDDPDLHAAALSALDTLGTRKATKWDVEGPTLCHGYAGVLLSVPAHHTVAESAVEAVNAHFDPGHRFGFHHHDHGRIYDEPGLLTGATGIALAMSDHTGLPARDVPVQWDCLLNLS